MNDKEKRDGNFIRRGLQNFISKHPEMAATGILVAYSGGIDSATLLSALAGCAVSPLRAVHVVHNLRPPEELRREREVVEAYCRRLHIPLTVATVRPGAIEKLANEKQVGLEAAAREIRYGILKRIARRLGFRFIATAHNADDQLETLMSRFIASSSVDGLAGMAQSHDLGNGLCLVRPLLFASRKDIERYAEVERLPVSNDSTNAALNYTRNRIRHELVPILDRDFQGWRKGLLGTSVKIASDKAALNEYLGRFMRDCDIDTAKNAASIDFDAFKKAPEAIKIRVLARCVAAISKNNRLSHEALRGACNSLAHGAPGADVLGARISVRGERLEILPVLDFRIEDRYFFLIPSEGTYHAGLILVSLWWGNGAEREDRSRKGRGFLLEGAFSFPLIVRSRKPGDAMMTGNCVRRLDDIMKSWHLDQGRRNMVPVVEDRNGIVAVLASSLEGAGLEQERFRDYDGSKVARRLFISIKGA